jgi:hypothetical protein
MEKGYYKPEIEEFCVGFEYESYADDQEDDRWCDETFDELHDFGTLKYMLGQDFIRVKLIDEEDILSEGFIRMAYEIGMWTDFERFYNDPRMSKNLCGIHFTRVGWCLITIYNIEDGFEDRITKFSGTIRNRTELKKLLKQLGV